MDLRKLGVAALSRGARRGNGPLSGLGLGLALVGLLRRRSRPRRELVWAKTLRPGDAIRIRHLDSGDEIEVEG